ncbi:MAG: hypothetical protein JNL53_17500 [Cyclobacteriaceae bacterium]|nr:hypothetical protein [Cyclobacteriaceae bacterium]
MNVTKQIYYTLFTPSLPKDTQYRFGFIFHTEKIYALQTFNQLIRFCRAFEELTGKRALCVVMTPENPLIRKNMEVDNVTEDEFFQRLMKLNQYADIGYHGHFWKSNQKSFLDTQNQITPQTSFFEFKSQVAEQFEREVVWLRERGFSITSYAGGWWFVNPLILDLLQKMKIQYDFTFSLQIWVKNNWAQAAMQRAQIHFGEVFKSTKETVTHVQTLMGCPNSNYPQDFVRILNKYTSANFNTLGMITTHDYNIETERDLARAIELIRYLRHFSQVSFFSLADLALEPVEKQILIY